MSHGARHDYKLGFEAELGSRVMKQIPGDDLKPVLKDLLIEHFGAKQKQSPERFVPQEFLTVSSN